MYSSATFCIYKVTEGNYGLSGNFLTDEHKIFDFEVMF